MMAELCVGKSPWVAEIDGHHWSPVGLRRGVQLSVGLLRILCLSASTAKG